ncbi:MAG TPA: hypothetical protein VJ463_02845 [Geothrix sp.]|nr:hypothetical protein [Geothrix sp.]
MPRPSCFAGRDAPWGRMRPRQPARADGLAIARIPPEPAGLAKPVQSGLSVPSVSPW